LSSSPGVNSQRSSSSVRFIVGFSRCGRGRVQTPLGPQGFFYSNRVAELEVAGLLGDYCALVLRGETGDKSCHKLAQLLGV